MYNLDVACWHHNEPKDEQDWRDQLVGSNGVKWNRFVVTENDEVVQINGLA